MIKKQQKCFRVSWTVADEPEDYVRAQNKAEAIQKVKDILGCGIESIDAEEITTEEYAECSLD